MYNSFEAYSGAGRAITGTVVIKAAVFIELSICECIRNPEKADPLALRFKPRQPGWQTLIAPKLADLSAPIVLVSLLMSARDRAKDWLSQALNDLEWGENSRSGKFYSQTCFIAQQAAEKSLKALAYLRGNELVKSHSAFALAKALGFSEAFLDKGRTLDQYYIGARYPDGLPEGAPHNMFTEKQAKEALDFARTIVKAVQEEFEK